MKSDKFADAMVALGAFLNLYRRHAIVIVGAIVICVLGTLWYWRGKAAEIDDLWRRVNDVDMGLFALSPEARTKEALDKAIDVLMAINAQQPDAPVGLYALLQTADLQYQQKDYAAAATTYQQVMSAPKAPETYRQLAADALGPTLEQGGKWEAALALYKALAAGKSASADKSATADKPATAGNQSVGSHDETLAAQLYWSMGRCLDRLGKPDEAAQAREEASKLAPGSTWAEMSKVDAALNVQAATRKPESPEAKPETSKPATAGKPAPADKPAPAEKSAETTNPAPAPPGEAAPGAK